MSRLSENKGFSLLEVLVSLATGVVMLGAVVSLFMLLERIFHAQESEAEALQTVRATINVMTSEIMMAGFSPNLAASLQRTDDSLPNFTGVVYDPSGLELEIRADINRNGVIVTEKRGDNPDGWKYDPNERIVYRQIGTQLKRKTGGGYFQPLAMSVRRFQFFYYKSDGTPASCAADIRNVKLVITSEVERPAHEKARRQQELAAYVHIRNMGLH